LKIGAPNDYFYNNRAFAEIKLKKYDDAIESYNQAISINSNNHVYYKNRANLYMEKGNVDKAILDITDAI
jgi:tetratricopeptide (TPR) repeat protein